MMKRYIKPTIEMIEMSSDPLLLNESLMDGGGNRGDYVEGTQAGRGYCFDWDEEEE